ncbi:hypothetical protein KCP75_05355 [Salmonella enterica subsp. enterica]|nr:hypothetical protein KCP75_05355 [Salmonella enterica subsp. enterica]
MRSGAAGNTTTEVTTLFTLLGVSRGALCVSPLLPQRAGAADRNHVGPRYLRWRVASVLQLLRIG